MEKESRGEELLAESRGEEGKGRMEEALSTGVGSEIWGKKGIRESLRIRGWRNLEARRRVSFRVSRLASCLAIHDKMQRTGFGLVVVVAKGFRCVPH